MKIVILGGGISGLVVAQQLEQQHEVIVISPDLGGLIQSFDVSGGRFDTGGHVYSATSKIAPFLRSIGAIEHQRKAFYFHKWKDLIPYPVQDFADQLDLKIQPAEAIDTANFGRLAYSLFGQDFCEKWFFPFNRRVWTSSPFDMDTDWMINRVKLPTQDPQPTWGPNQTFLYVPGSKIVDALQPKLWVEDRVVRIDIKNKCVTLLNSDSTIDFDILISTLPIETLCLLSGQRRPQAGLPYNHVLSVGIMLDRKIEADFSWIYCDLASPAHRITLLSRYFPGNATDDRDSLLVEFPYRGQAVDFYPELDKIRRAFEAKIAFTWVRHTLGYPIPRMSARYFVQQWKKQLPDYVYSIGRWGSHAYYNIEHICHEAEATARLILGDATIDDIDDYTWGKFYYGS